MLNLYVSGKTLYMFLNMKKLIKLLLQFIYEVSRSWVLTDVLEFRLPDLYVFFSGLYLFACLMTNYSISLLNPKSLN